MKPLEEVISPKENIEGWRKDYLSLFWIEDSRSIKKRKIHSGVVLGAWEGMVSHVEFFSEAQQDKDTTVMGDLG